MRTIKFRGICIKTKHWLYGDLVQDTEGGCYIYPIDCDGLYRDNKVVSETVGQYTGLRDANGREIYEGDIVRHPYIDPIFRAIVDGSSVESKVAFHNGAFVINYDVDDFIYLDAFIREGHVEVVGNIHDNPELNK